MQRMRTRQSGEATKRRRPERSRGATLVEAAIVLPVILLVVIGTMEIGLVFKDFLTAGSLSREGARIAALAGDTNEADCIVLEGIGDLASQGDLGKVVLVEIFKAAEGTGDPVAGEINEWTYDGGDPSKCSIPSALDDNWTNTNGQQYGSDERNTEIGSTPLDIVGVRITMNHQWITGFPPFRGTVTIEETTITRVEPDAFEDT